METGYKVFKSSVLKEITLVEKTFSFEPESLPLSSLKRRKNFMRFQLLTKVDLTRKEKK